MFGRGTWLLAGAAVVTCIVLIGPGEPVGARSTAPLPAEDVRDVVPNRVVTWNICNPCDEGNIGRAADIAALAPQVIGMQEACVRDVERVREYLKRRHGLEYHVEYGSVLRNRGRCGGTPWNQGAFGQAILSAAPMTDRVSVEYPDGGSEDRGYMAVTTAVDGQPVRVFNTHLAQRRQESVRAGQVRVLAAEVARHDRAIVLGDFNAVPGSAELKGMWKVAADADPGCRPSSSGNCTPTTDWRLKFDYVFLRGASPAKQGVQLTPNSDHDLVHADVSLKAAP
ncbi:endonuclease/exonuclease/phosphatase family protein [Streptomyces sp. NPDC048057]|uniref:endonuclease/exonuclease/phosphatase family protein n=1 Tax=Streptomyces sp. NPDC048057 TaxID=3155628 RepID=UPI003406780B